MSPDNLKSACEGHIAEWEKREPSVKGPFPAISLVVKHLARGENTRLFSRHGPMSKFICNVQFGKGTVAIWDAREILEWMKKNDI